MSIYEASIDDNDPQIIYSDGWVLVTSDGDWRGTMHSTSNIGASARVRFTGTRVAFVCTIPTGDGQLSQASFSVDNGPAVRVTHATTPPVQWQTTFWDSGPLPYGSHLIVMTNVGNTAYLRLDRIDYDPTTANAPAVSVPPSASSGDITTTVRSTLTSTVVVGSSDTQTSSSSSSIAPSALVVSSGGQSSTFPNNFVSFASLDSSSQTVTLASLTNSITGSSTPGAKLGDTDTGSAINPDSAGKAGPPVAAIIGGVLGALLAIALVVLALLYCRRKRVRAAYLNDPSTDTAPSRWTTSTVPTPLGVNRRSHEMLSTSNLMVQTQSNGLRGATLNAAMENSSIPSSPYSDSRGPMLSGTTASTSMYHSEGSASALYDTQQYQHNGNVSTPVRPKHAEFMAEQQQQAQQADTSVAGGQQVQYGRGADGRLSLGLGGGSSSVGAFQDHDAPPAYPGIVQDVEASPGPAWKS
ncbi:hypothetical protein CVT25_013577 [Psilocybe cyanescens]|uniref:Transmembrane protein n=1 Tax=Psilocybe cyanescens TaxID=93625 RepID=A0A409XT18_PSICY|nr:hypothetical protein CVT25_013577 [Psilocybe cyanescens]